MRYADLVREARHRAGVSQSELAVRASELSTVVITQSHVSRWERGDVTPSYAAARLLHEALRLTAQQAEEALAALEAADLERMRARGAE